MFYVLVMVLLSVHELTSVTRCLWSNESHACTLLSAYRNHKGFSLGMSLSALAVLQLVFTFEEEKCALPWG